MGGGKIFFVKDEKGNEYFAKIFIDASGVAGVISRKLELQDQNFPIGRGLEYNVEYFGPQSQCHLFIGKSFKGGYGWIFPCGGNRAIFGYATMDSSIHEDLKKRIEEVLKLPAVKKLVRKDNEKINGGTIPTNIKNKFVKGNAVCVGDSVSQVNPLVGEGYRFVLETGLIASSYIEKAIRENDLNILLGYEEEWKRKFWNKYLCCKNLQKLADKASKFDFTSDFLAIFLWAKRNKTFVNLISGNITRKDLYLP